MRRNRISPLFRAGLILVLLGACFLSISTAWARPPEQDLPIIYERYDVAITLNPDGTFTVREIQQIRFGDTFRTAFAEIPRAYTGDINNIRVKVDGQPYQAVNRTPITAGTYAVDDADPQNIYVEWRYEPTEAGQVHTFELAYRVTGGLWVYPQETVLEWRAVPADRSGFPVEESRITVNLPEDVAADELRYTAYGPAFNAEDSSDQVIFTATEPIPDGTRFQIRIGLPPNLVPAERQPWQIAEDTARLAYRLESVEVDLAIDREGRVNVTERQQVAVEAGAMHGGHRSLSLAYLDEVSNVEVFEGDQPFSRNKGSCEAYCFEVTEEAGASRWVWYSDYLREVVIQESRAGEVNINWFFPALVKGEATTFRLAYQVAGAIQVQPDRQRLNWTVLLGERDVPVESASLGVQLPPGVSWEEVQIEGANRRIKLDGELRLVPPESLTAGQHWQVGLILPAEATLATKPAWQQAIEAAEVEARQVAIRRARQQIGVGLAAGLLLIGGLVGTGLAWRWWGRDRTAVTTVEYLTEPPSDLPPGIVAYLVDETPTTKGVLASLFHLAGLGLLRLHMTDSWLRLQRNWPDALEEGQMLETATGQTITVPGHLIYLFNALRPHIPVDKPVALTAISTDFQAALPGTYVDMAEEATRFFTQRPEVSRHRWLSWGQGLVLAGVILAVVAWYFYQTDLGWIVQAPPLALALVGLALMLVSRWMPQRTAAGVEEAARWRAFRTYLANLKSYSALPEAQKILDRYFAYAVALDVEEVVLTQAENLGAAMPVWTQPVRLEAITEPPKIADRGRPGGPKEDRPAVPLRVVPATSTPQPGRAGDSRSPVRHSPTTTLSLQGLSDQLGQTLAKASRHIDQVMNTAMGNTQGVTPFRLVAKGAGATARTTWKATQTTMEVVGDILESAATGSGSGGYSGSSGSRSSSSRSSWSSSSSSRSSSSRRSGGGGRRGFG